MAINTLERQIELAEYTRAANAIVDLESLPMTKEIEDVQRRIIRGEISVEEAVASKIKSIKGSRS